ETTAKSSIQERKIRVTFLPPDSSVALEHSETNGIVCPRCCYYFLRPDYGTRHDLLAFLQALPEEELPAYTSPATTFDTPSATNRSASVKADSMSQPSFEHEKPKRGSIPSSTESPKPSGMDNLKAESIVAGPASNDDL